MKILIDAIPDHLFNVSKPKKGILDKINVSILVAVLVLCSIPSAFSGKDEIQAFLSKDKVTQTRA